MKISNTVSIQPYEKYEADIVLDRIEHEGVPESKKPIILNCRFEQTGKVFKLTTWEYSSLNNFKKLVDNHHICNISFTAKIYNDIISFNLNTYKDTGKDSKLEVKNLSTDFYENEIKKMISNVSNEKYKKILEKMIVGDFYVWPAAYSMHHAFPGGLALHSYSVTRIALTTAETYSYSKINKDLLITGSLLHDIGKLKEYSQNGNTTINGNLIAHLVLGIEMINDTCRELNIDPNDEDIVLLKHIILSHHGKYEYGSPVLPKSIEAYIISQADNTDSKVEAIEEAFENNDNGFFNEDAFTQPIKAMEGRKFLLPKQNNKII